MTPPKGLAPQNCLATTLRLGNGRRGKAKSKEGGEIVGEGQRREEKGAELGSGLGGGAVGRSEA